MDIKNMHEMIEKLVCCAKAEMDKRGIEEIDTEEMGEVADIIKDLSEAQYYRTLVEAMGDAEYGEDYDWSGPYEEERRGYRGQPRDSMGRYRRRRGYEDKIPVEYGDNEYMRDMDRHMGRMYYTETSSSSTTPARHQMMHNDGKEGRSGMMRRSYMESKEKHKGNTAEDKQHKMKELENYMNELGSDITEMIADSTPEEKSMLKTKLQTLATKIS